MAVLLVVVLLLAVAAVNHDAVTALPGGWKAPLAYLLALAFGTSVGAAELVARYRDRPAAALNSLPATIYMGVNALASVVAFWLLMTGRLDFKINIFGAHPALNALFLGGFGAMAVFRTAVFNVKVGDTNVAVGPAAVLQVILRAADRETDRLRAGPRAADIDEVMRGVVYLRARDPLPVHCFALMQNLTLEEQAGVEQALSVLDQKKEMGDQAKAYGLGLLLMNLVGEDVLRRAVAGLGDRIKGPIPDVPPVLSRARELALADLGPLLECCRALSASGATVDAETDGGLIVPPSNVTRESDRVVIALVKLRQRFGPETVAAAIDALVAARVTQSGGPIDDANGHHATGTHEERPAHAGAERPQTTGGQQGEIPPQQGHGSAHEHGDQLTPTAEGGDPVLPPTTQERG